VKADRFSLVDADGISLLVPGFFKSLGLRGGYSTRAAADGRLLDFDLRGEKDRTAIIDNRRVVLGAMGALIESLVVAEQLHGSLVARVTSADAGRGATDPAAVIAGADALVTDAPEVALAALSADCPIILLADEGRRAVAAVHSGWRGAAAGVVTAAVASLGEYGASAERLFASIGPAIGACCYEVGKEVRAAFPERIAGAEGVFVEREGRLFLDLVRAAELQLLDSGVRSDRISTAGVCTSCRNDLFFSYRREGKAAGRTAGVIALA
jgi:YfiH family protein